MNRLALVLSILVARVALAVELYFEFDERAASASIDPPLFFCKAAISTLLPTYDDPLWCYTNASFTQRVTRGRLQNARLTLPSAPTRPDEARSALSEALLREKFFASPANVTLVTDWTHDYAINASITTITFFSLLIVSLFLL